MPTQVKNEIQGTNEELRKFLCVTYLSLMFLLWMVDKEYDLHMAKLAESHTNTMKNSFKIPLSQNFQCHYNYI
jgi:hypothetical protein